MPLVPFYQPGLLSQELKWYQNMEFFILIWYHFPPRCRPGGVNNGTKRRSSVLIKFQADDALVDSLKAFTGQATGSKAVALAAEQALDMAAEIRALRRDLEDARRSIRVQRQTLDSARAAAAALVEATGQGDLLD